MTSEKKNIYIVKKTSKRIYLVKKLQKTSEKHTCTKKSKKKIKHSTI